MRIDTKKVDIARLQRGLLLKELAAKAGVSDFAVNRACTHGECGVVVARSIAKALGLELADIVTDYGVGETSDVTAVAG